MIEIIQKMTCDICGDVESVVQPVSLYSFLQGIISYSFPPRGWRQVDDKLICPNHVVSIKDYVETAP